MQPELWEQPDGAGRSVGCRSRAGLVPVEGRHARQHVPGARKGLGEDGALPTLLIRVRRLQHQHDAGLLGDALPVVCGRRRLRAAEPARRRRVRRRLARGRDARHASRTSSTTSSPRPSGSSRKGYTNPSRLAISGGSNGGLLTGAALTQRPDLFRAAIVAVPLLDMLRYQQFLMARYWVPEYGIGRGCGAVRGSCRAYSPYHHVRGGHDVPGRASDRRRERHARARAARAQDGRRCCRPRPRPIRPSSPSCSGSIARPATGRASRSTCASATRSISACFSCGSWASSGEGPAVREHHDPTARARPRSSSSSLAWSRTSAA